MGGRVRLGLSVSCATVKANIYVEALQGRITEAPTLNPGERRQKQEMSLKSEL